jgi:hypothetical protein
MKADTVLADNTFIKKVMCLLYPNYSKELDDIIWDNSRAHGNVQELFQHDGTLYKLSYGQYHPGVINTLHRSMKRRFRALQREAEETEKERERIERYLKSVFTVAQNTEDYRQMLPEQLHSAIPHIPSNWGCPRLPQYKMDSFLACNEPALILIRSRLTINLIAPGA